MLDELEVPYTDLKHFVLVHHAAALTSTLISSVTRSHVKVFSGYELEDVLFRDQRDLSPVKGIALSFVGSSGGGTSSVGAVGAQLDSFKQSLAAPILTNAKVIISACGMCPELGGGVALRKIASLGWGESLCVFGAGQFGASDVEDSLVHHTREVSPGLIVAGGELSWLDLCGKAGPTSGAMLLSGIKAAGIALACVRAIDVKELEKKSGLETSSHFIGDRI